MSKTNIDMFPDMYYQRYWRLSLVYPMMPLLSVSGRNACWDSQLRTVCEHTQKCSSTLYSEITALFWNEPRKTYSGIQAYKLLRLKVDLVRAFSRFLTDLPNRRFKEHYISCSLRLMQSRTVTTGSWETRKCPLYISILRETVQSLHRHLFLHTVCMYV